MTPINLQNLLLQRDDTRERLILAWGRLSGSLTLPVVAEIEALAHEFDLLSKIHSHAIADGTCPASLLAVLAKTDERQRSRFSASAAGLATPTLAAASDDFAGGRGGQGLAIQKPTPEPMPSAGEVF